MPKGILFEGAILPAFVAPLARRGRGRRRSSYNPVAFFIQSEKGQAVDG
jgi:hypothetical protein